MARAPGGSGRADRGVFATEPSCRGRARRSLAERTGPCGAGSFLCCPRPTPDSVLAESLSPRLTQKPPPQRSVAGASQLLRERVPSPRSHPCKWHLDFPRFRSPSCHQTVGSRGMSTNLHLISIASELGRKMLRGFIARSGLCFVLFLEIGFGSHEEKRGTHSGKDNYQHTPSPQLRGPGAPLGGSTGVGHSAAAVRSTRIPSFYPASPRCLFAQGIGVHFSNRWK